MGDIRYGIKFKEVLPLIKEEQHPILHQYISIRSQDEE
jgi:hypothetical protein